MVDVAPDGLRSAYLPPDVIGLVPRVEVMTGPTGGTALAVAAALVLGIATRAGAFALLLALPLAAIGQDGDARLPLALLICILVFRGAGSLSVDARLAALPFRGGAPIRHRDPHHVVVVGGGFGGIAAAKGLGLDACRVTLVDRNNHHLFQPLPEAGSGCRTDRARQLRTRRLGPQKSVVAHARPMVRARAAR